MDILGKAVMKARGADYYDWGFKRCVGIPQKLKQKRYRNAVAASHTVGSVLDLGCGLGFLADLIGEREYLGVDFSLFAVRWARENTANPNARFWMCDIYKLPQNAGRFDTVALVEVLEHVDDPQLVCALALRHAKKRIVVIVPQNMAGRAHVWPAWDRAKLEALLGDLAVCKLVSSKKPKMTESLLAVKVL